jgi:hypothetical protein
MTNEAFTSRAAIEGFADAVVDGFPRQTEVELDGLPRGPVIKRSRGELRSVVAFHDAG